MKTIYLDSDFRCHVSNDGTMTAVSTEFFDGKCDTFVEGYRFIPAGSNWIRADGAVFRGPMAAPVAGYATLAASQRQYELMLPEIEDLRAALESAMSTLEERL